MAILAGAGLLPPSKSGCTPKAVLRQPVRYEESAFWSTISGLIDAEALGHFRVMRAADVAGAMCLTLYLHPGQVIRALAQQPGFLFCTRKDLRASAASWPTWVPGRHNIRLVAGGESAKAWMFQSSDPDNVLMKLMLRLQEASNTKQ